MVVQLERPLARCHRVNPPGPEGSKGKQALSGARGVPACPGRALQWRRVHGALSHVSSGPPR
jgi:hypothetical protein